ncbi:histone-lysine N-methyltransferase SETMAR [Elysia marginata]|uniref:Histone-lysine N-methyltransferase SETMAR n=1 Tax=Elysia marginata TaxID=1093978 RepID=A0AAV4H8T2_9GAST|nr:histone-lysine N-methyltransferase SETMAR [Elysia marginata]
MYISKMLRGNHKLQRVGNLLQRCQQGNGDENETHIGVRRGGDFLSNNNLFHNVVTGGKTWVHLNNSETKCGSMTWKHPSFAVAKNFKAQRSVAEVTATVFLDAKCHQCCPLLQHF